MRSSRLEPERESTDTCNDRIRRFWRWFQEVAPAFYEAIEAGDCHTLEAATSENIDRMFPGFDWAYGPGESGIGHSLTLTGVGVEHRQLLALQWLSLAPVIDGWTFYAARQPGPGKERAMEIHGHLIKPEEIWVTPCIDEDREHVDLTIWHPLWPRIEENHRWQTTFLLLDEALGEYGTGWWVGTIRLEADRLADSFPLKELRQFMKETSEREGWKKYPPGQGTTIYKYTPSGIDYPRSDLITLSTVVPWLCHEYEKAEGRLEDPLAGTGADYLYLAIPRVFFPKGREVLKRGEVEDALDSALKGMTSGRCIGAGLGSERGYVDLLIFDGERSVEIILETLEAFDLPEGTTIEYFAKEKATNRIHP